MYMMVRFNYSYFSALAVGLTVALYAILIIYPYRLENNKYTYQEQDKFLVYIIISSVLIVTAYVLYKGMFEGMGKKTTTGSVQTVRIVTE